MCCAIVFFFFFFEDVSFSNLVLQLVFVESAILFLVLGYKFAD